MQIGKKERESLGKYTLYRPQMGNLLLDYFHLKFQYCNPLKTQVANHLKFLRVCVKNPWQTYEFY